MFFFAQLSDVSNEYLLSISLTEKRLRHVKASNVHGLESVKF